MQIKLSGKKKKKKSNLINVNQNYLTEMKTKKLDPGIRNDLFNRINKKHYHKLRN